MRCAMDRIYTVLRGVVSSPGSLRVEIVLGRLGSDIDADVTSNTLEWDRNVF